MKKTLLAVLVCLSQTLHADDTFLSLTRRATRTDHLPTNISVITAEEIKELGATNLPDIIDLLPGIKTESGGGLNSLTTVKMRGVPTSNQVQVLIDDQPLGGSSIQNIDIGIIPVENIERIEVVRGASSSLYGANTIGGIIHIFTKKAEQPFSSTLSAEGRSHKTQIYTAQAEASQANVTGYILGRRIESGGYQQNTDFKNSYAFGSLGYAFNNGASVDFDYSNTQQEQGTPGGTPVAFKDWNGDRERAAFTPDDRIDKDIDNQRIKIAVPFPDVMVQIVGHRYTDERSWTAFFPTKSKNTILGDDIRLMFINGLTIGAAYEKDKRIALGQDTHSIISVGRYIQKDFRFNKLIVAPALRWDEHSIFGEEYNPHLSLVYNENDTLKFSANAARAVRAPTITDLFEDFIDAVPAWSFFANPNLKPETAWTYDLGTELKSSTGFNVALTGFYTEIKDRIVAVNTDNLVDPFGNQTNDTLANAAKAEISGAEVETSLRTGRFTHKASYTYQRAKGTSATSSHFVSLRLTPRHMASYTLISRLWKGSTLANTYQYVSHQFDNDNYTGTYLAPRRLWNARLEQVCKSFTVFGEVDNITNELYSESTLGNPVPEPTRTYRAGLSVKLGGS